MRIPILSYHSINNSNSNLSLDTDSFEKQMIYLKKRNYKSVNFDQINLFKKKQIIITFDDGYKDVLINALPILKKYNFNATCFFVSNFIGKRNDWDLNTEDYISKDLMTLADINEWISNGMFIGSHSHNHLDLTKLKINELNNELTYSKKILEDKFGCNVRDFCYPFGKVNKLVYEQTKKYFDRAVTTNRGLFQTNKHNFHLIPRVDMGKKISLFKIILKLETIYEDIKFNKNAI